MRILTLFHGLYPCRTGGMEIFNYHLVRGLRERGHEVTVVTTCQKTRLEESRFTHIFAPKALLSTKLTVTIRTSILMVQLRDNYDVVLVPYTNNAWLNGIYIPFVTRFLRKPYVISIHSGGLHEWGPKIIRQLFFHNASAISGVSKRISDEYSRRTGKEVRIILPLIPFERCETEKVVLRKRWNIPMEASVILFVGSLKAIKRCDILLKSFIELLRVCDREIRPHLVFVGDGPLRLQMEIVIRNTGVKSDVTFTGVIEHDRVPELFGLADLYVISSQYEGTSMSLLEAMFNGLPIIGADSPGINSIIVHGKNGLLYKTECTEELTKMIRELLYDPRKMNMLGNAARDHFLREYRYEEVVDAHIDIFGSAFSERNSFTPGSKNGDRKFL